MKPLPPVLAVGVILVVVLGLPFGLYALLSRGRRKILKEIKEEAARRGWEFRKVGWMGDPTAFRIAGWDQAGRAWTLKSVSAGEANHGWSVRVRLRFPKLAGDVDVAVIPRDAGGRKADITAPHFSRQAQTRLAAFSGTAASAFGFLENAQETPSNLPEFDSAYHVLGQGHFQTPIDSALADRMMHWPADTVAAHSILAWRDPFGVHFEARLPRTPNWATINYLVSLAGDFCGRLPPPVTSPTRRGFVDRLLAPFLRS